MSAAMLTVVLALQARVLTLDEAVRSAQAHQPQLRQARAGTAAARARADEARAPLLPQLTGTASYQRTTANFILRPGAVPPSLVGMTGGGTFDSFNFYSFGATLSQFIWDFGQTTDRFRASRALADAQAQTERATGLQVALNVRAAYFSARAQRALVGVAKETLTNQERHLNEVQGFVRVGSRPEIDLAQARTDRANAQVQLITAEGNYEAAKALLNQAMGVEGPTDYDVQEETLQPLPDEDQGIEPLVGEALKTRPELASLERQIRAQELTVSAVKGAYGPALSASSTFTAGGTDITQLGWNWNAGINLSWGLFQGLLTYSQTAEAKANLAAVEAQRDGLRQQVRVELDQARLQVRAAKATVSAAGEAMTNARERLRLAEGRYRAGVGTIIELGDAQVAATSAAAQQVQAEYNLATARAQLMRALGRGF